MRGDVVRPEEMRRDEGRHGIKYFSSYYMPMSIGKNHFMSYDIVVIASSYCKVYNFNL